MDHIIVTDNLSVDRTADILDGYASRGVVTLIKETDDNYAQAKWVTRMAALAQEAGARWIINNDADEFWVAPKGRTLSEWFARQVAYNCAEATRHDFICLEDDGTPFWQRMIWRKSHSTNPLGKPLPPKVAHRARKALSIRQGNHGVDGFSWKRTRKNALEILHFPLRSRGQYIRKIENGGRAYANNTELSKSVGSTWRRQWTELQETGTLAYLEENIVSKERHEAMIASGEAVEDRRLAEAMAELG